VDLNEDSQWYPTLLFQLCPDGWFYLNELGLARGCAVQLPTAEEQEQRILSPALQSRGNFVVNQSVGGKPRPDNFLVHMLLPATFSILPRWACVQASVDMARLGCALERWRRAEGTYPDTLTALKPRFVASLPKDIVNGEPLHYRRTADGGFVLCSVGWNEKDDGGVAGVKAYGPQKNEDDFQGDWVWQYPENAP
jgi:hypothetical protein